MRNLLPDSEPHSLTIFRLDDRRRALRPTPVEQRARTVDISDAFLSTDELAALEGAPESLRNS